VFLKPYFLSGEDLITQKFLVNYLLKLGVFHGRL